MFLGAVRAVPAVSMYLLYSSGLCVGYSGTIGGS